MIPSVMDGDAKRGRMVAYGELLDLVDCLLLVARDTMPVRHGRW